MQQPPINQSLQLDLKKLPSMPHVLLKLLEAFHDPDVGFEKLSKIILTDPAITARIMSVANSGAYQQWSQYKDFNRLLVAFGLKMVKVIAINSSVQQFFSQFNVDNDSILAQFWQTSLTTASISKALAHITGYQNEEEAYIAGLLHRVGELACITHNEEEYQNRVKQLWDANATYSCMEMSVKRTKMEQEFAGLSIPEIGSWIIHNFDKHSFLGDALLYQREEAVNLIGTSHLVQIVNLAQKLAGLEDIHTRDALTLEAKEAVFDEVQTLFDLTYDVQEELLENCLSEVRTTAKGMEIHINNENIIQINHKKIQIKLAENVRTIALSSSLQQMCSSPLENTSEKELIEQIMQNLRILFGISHCLYFTFNEQSNELQAKYGSSNIEPLLTQFNLSLDITSTLPVQALIKGTPVSSQEHLSQESIKIIKSSVLNQQLQQLLNTQEILCIPLLESLCENGSNKNTKYGVMVTGVSATHLQRLKREKGLLYEFSKASSQSLSREIKNFEQLQSIIEEETSLQSLEISKLVHEANNPLSVIRNYLQILSHKLADYSDEKLPGQLDILIEEVERVGNIILKIRETPQKSPLGRDQVDLNELLNKLMSIFNDSLFLKAGITTKLNLDESIPVIASSSSNLKQIITNLLKNAVESMPDGGEIAISTNDQISYNGEQFIELSIIDNGPGIPLEILNNLFNPVKSTKGGEHSGLGLSIIKTLINDMGGMIRGSNRHSTSSDSGSKQHKIIGAEFIILLPRKMIKTQ